MDPELAMLGVRTFGEHVLATLLMLGRGVGLCEDLAECGTDAALRTDLAEPGTDVVECLLGLREDLAEPGAEGGRELGPLHGTFNPFAEVHPPFITLSLCCLATMLMSGEIGIFSRVARG